MHRRHPDRPRSPFPAMTLVAALALGSTTACTTESVRRATYPAQFHYLTRPSIQSAMWKLADRVVIVEARLRVAPPLDDAGRAEIVRLLVEMEAAGGELASGGLQSNHPEIDANLDRFRAELKQARVAAEQTPPNYFLAGSITGACMLCHGDRIEPR
jgi:hypothetical protein